MRHSSVGKSSERYHLALVAAVVLGFIVTIGVYFVHHDPSSTSRLASTQEIKRTTAGAPPSAGGKSTTLSPRTADPRRFAQFVAYALFNWDTAHDRQGHVARLVNVADPTGEESPGLVADVTNYLPAPTAWLQLRRHGTRQWLEIDSIRTPSRWASAIADARPGQVLPGTIAFTIEGTRNRVGSWRSDVVTSQHDMEFTVFVVCRPSYPRCHLLRLSLPNKPLA